MNKPALEIEKLVRATSRPYPGAYGVYKDKKVIIWKARAEKNTKYFGIPGQIAYVNDVIGVITIDGVLIIEEYEIENVGNRFIVGHKFK